MPVTIHIGAANKLVWANSMTPWSPNALLPTYPLSSAPKDGTLIMIWVSYVQSQGLHDTPGNPLYDATHAWTVGFNNYENDGEDVWKFAGWNWEQDCFDEGAGHPILWAPMPFKDTVWDHEGSFEYHASGGATF